MRFRCLYFIVVVMLLSQPLFAADDDSLAVRKKILPGDWTFVSTPALTVNEKLYNNWSAAGNSTLVFVFGFNGTYKYTHQQFVWDNVHDFSLGVDRQDLDGNQSLESVRKNEDKIDLTSTISKRLRSAWNINFSVNFKSQFLEGKNYATSGNSEYTLVSKFMAPGYLTTSIGFEYKEPDWNVSMSFLSGKTTFVTSQEVIDAGQLYGVDTTGGRRSYLALGSYFKFYFKRDIFPNFNLYMKLELFYDYNKVRRVDWSLDPEYVTTEERTWRSIFHHTDINLECSINYKLSKWLAISGTLNMKYDNDYANVGSFGHWQMYQLAGLRFFYKSERKR